MKRDLLEFLKDRKIFTKGGHKTLRAWLNNKEQQELYKHTSRKSFKKQSKKG